MIYRIRTITLSRKEIIESRSVFTEAANYINSKYPDVTSEILINISGSLNQIHWSTKCDSLAILEAYEAKRNQDPEWIAIVQKWFAEADPQDMVDNFYEVIS